MGVVEAEGTVADTTGAEEAEATCLEVVTYPETEGGATRTVEVAMEVGVEVEWEVMTKGPEVSLPVEAVEVVVEAAAVFSK
jgi:hypothetical protein